MDKVTIYDAKGSSCPAVMIDGIPENEGAYSLIPFFLFKLRLEMKKIISVGY